MNEPHNNKDLIAEFQRQTKRSGREHLPGSVRRGLILGLIVWVTAAVEASFLSYLPLFGATIEVTAALILLLGWHYGPVMGGTLGVLGGFVLDSLLPGNGLTILPILFFIFGVLAAVAAEQLHRHPLTFLLTGTAAMLLLSAVRAVEAGSLFRFFATLLGGVLATLAMYGIGMAVFRKKV